MEQLFLEAQDISFLGILAENFVLQNEKNDLSRVPFAALSVQFDFFSVKTQSHRVYKRTDQNQPWSQLVSPKAVSSVPLLSIEASPVSLKILVNHDAATAKS